MSTKSTPSPLLIFGTGALGTLFAARLSAAGYAVTVLGTWTEALEALAAGGARIRWPDGREEAHPVAVAASPEEVAPARYAIVLVKSWQTPRVARWLQQTLAADGLALTLQNGLGNDEVLAEALGHERVAAGVTIVGATVVAPGVVRVSGNPIVTLGEHPRLAPLQQALAAAGFEVEARADVRGVIWGKLAINAGLNPLTALLGVPNGGLLEDPAARLFMRRAAQEVAAVAAAQGITLPYDDAAAAVEDIARRTAPNLSSMLQDLRRGAPTEIDAICGAVARRGREVGAPAPLNEALWAMIRERVAKP